MPVQLGAILTAMVTPFDAQGRVDEDAAVRLMHHLLDHGSDGLVICGTTGEAVSIITCLTSFGVSALGMIPLSRAFSPADWTIPSIDAMNGVAPEVLGVLNHLEVL